MRYLNDSAGAGPAMEANKMTFITRATLAAALATVLAGSSPRDASAWQLTEAAARDEWATFAIDLGMFSPRTTFRDDMFGESNFESNPAIGVSAAAWPHQNVGVRLKVIRSETDGVNEANVYAPLAVQDPTQWSFSAEVTARYLLDVGTLSVRPYLGLGAGMRHYTWKAARHDESKFFTWTAAGGADIRPAALGPFGLNVELRGYRSQFNAFGVHGGNWRPGTPARPVADDVGTDIGFYGGVVDKLWSHDLMLTVGVSYSY
jgi:hypothetical protein